MTCHMVVWYVMSHMQNRKRISLWPTVPTCFLAEYFMEALQVFAAFSLFFTCAGSLNERKVSHSVWQLLLPASSSVSHYCFFGPIPWGHSGPLSHAMSLMLLWTSIRRRRATVVTPGAWQCKTGGVRRLAVANGPNYFFSSWQYVISIVILIHESLIECCAALFLRHADVHHVRLMAVESVKFSRNWNRTVYQMPTVIIAYRRLLMKLQWTSLICCRNARVLSYQSRPVRDIATSTHPFSQV